MAVTVPQARPSAKDRPVRPRVGLFVTCLVDLFRPSVGFAAVKLLEDAGCIVDVPTAQTCCGQPAYNSGDRADDPRDRRAGHRRLRALRLRRGAVGLLRRHDQGALSRAVRRRSATWQRKADALAAKTYELVSFLVDVHGCDAGRRRASTARHLSRLLLGPARARRQGAAAAAAGSASRASNSSRCTRPMSAAASAARSASSIPTSPTPSSRRRPATSRPAGADTLLAGDLGCLMNMAGKLQRAGNRRCEVRHVAEVLAGDDRRAADRRARRR